MTMISVHTAEARHVHADTARVAKASLRVDSRCELGEGILWCERQQVAWWIDIPASRLWKHRLADGQTRNWRLPDRAGSLALCESGRLLLGLVGGLHVLDVDDLDQADALQPEKWIDVPLAAPAVRVNDGRADRSGNFVFGTMNQDPQAHRLGRFHQYSQRHGLRPLAIEPVAIANSVCFSLDGDRLYYCDSLQRRIMSCTYDARTASVGEPEVFAPIEPPAVPDGAAIDREGRLWSAQWGAGRVVCHGKTGRIETIIEVSADQPTCLAFAGPLLDQILITTAREGLDEAQLSRQPGAGGVHLAHIAGVVGLPENRFDDR